MKTRLPALILLISFGQAPAAESLQGKVIRVEDGDSCTILLDDYRQVEVRLGEIDAPESGQPFGNRSRVYLRDLVQSKRVTVQVQDIDRYGRTVGRVWVLDEHGENVDVNLAMVRSGAAWVYRDFLRDRSLLAIEGQARREKRGLWGPTEAQAVPPWEWRAASRAGTASGGCAIRGNINSEGDRIYHVPGSRYYAQTGIDVARGERWFCSEAEARAAGWRAPRG